MFSHTLTTALEQLCPLSHDSCLNFFERVTLMHELYRVLSAISADTFSQHFRTYFIIPCNLMFYKHLKLLLRPQWSGDIRTVRARQGLNIQKKEISSGYLLFCIIESARRDSNSPNVGKATKIKEECTLSNVCLQAVYNLEIRVESCQGVCRADTFYPFTACYSGR